ncbi:MAG: helix-turn-helix domain-containing protein [Eubacteriales bacterium]|nr:helix-turn-helix domain-containing protein [Eubacteriales bacterium]
MLDNYKIGNRIALLRREKGLTGERFAEALGVSPQAVSKWENGKCLPETALLPAVAALLGTTIDSILMPQELFIADARYTCGDSYIVVTDVLNRAVVGNRLSFKAVCPIGGLSVEGPAVFVLTVKYRTPDGTFYAFAPQGETLELDFTSKGLTAKDGFEIVGAYYGTGEKYKPVMQKMEHYEYFRWDEIHVNHETFPSSPGVDQPEYLTVIYMNKTGIHVISCRENGALRYTDSRTALEPVDTSSCILPGVIHLRWGNTMPCTWAGALYAALTFMGEKYTYEQIMGMSGACWRVVFCEVWDWSALDALVAYSYDMPLYNAVGYEPVWACRLDKDERSAERRRIVADILRGRPVVAINLRGAAEWGVITGYSDNGKTLYCRTYFDGDRTDENEYPETENWPFLITHFGEKHEKPADIEILNGSLCAFVDSFEAPPRDGYFQGKQGYAKWMAGLANDSLWSEDCPQNDLDRRFDVHLSTVYQLVDARRCAAAYLTGCQDFADGEIAALLAKTAESCRGFAERLHLFKEELLKQGVSGFLGSGSGKGMREAQILLLDETLREESENAERAKRIIDLLKEKENNGITICRVIHKTYEENDDDTELYRYDTIRSYVQQSIPEILELDLEKKVIIKEDLSKDYIRGLHYDEDSEQGIFVRRHYRSILKAAAQWHAAFWENTDAFGKIGPEWRFETKENLAAHIAMMERDFLKYRQNEEAGEVPKVWEAFDKRFENHITPRQLDCFTEAVERLKNEYLPLVESRFRAAKNVTVIHGDMHPGTVYISKEPDNTVKFDGLGAVRLGLPGEDLAMLVALHIEPDVRKAQPLLDFYYGCLSESIKGYSYKTFMNDYKIAVMEHMFFTIRLINRGIYDFGMRDKAIRAYESFAAES